MVSPPSPIVCYRSFSFPPKSDQNIPQLIENGAVPSLVVSSSVYGSYRKKSPRLVLRGTGVKFEQIEVAGSKATHEEAPPLSAVALVRSVTRVAVAGV